MAAGSATREEVAAMTRKPPTSVMTTSRFIYLDITAASDLSNGRPNGIR
jgi:hypothetical protein